MALRNIIREGDERLRKVCRPVTEFNDKLHCLLDDMYETMQEANGAGLAAPQVGILRRAVIVDVGEGKVEMVNPCIMESDGEQYGCEGCLSLPGEWGMVHRPQKLRVQAQSRTGEAFTLEAEDYLAVAVCHELDHLDGVLYTDKADRMLTEEEIDELNGDDDEDD